MTTAADAAPVTRDLVAPGPEATRGLSLRLRVGGWTIAVFTLTLTAFTAIGIGAERRNLEELAQADAQAFLRHLAEMPQFRDDSAAAARALVPVRESVRSAGGELSLSRTGAPADKGAGVARPLYLRDGAFELRLRPDPLRLREVARRSIALHVFHGVLALAALLLGTEWILRRRLVAPLASMSHELQLMTKGWGWRASVPAADRELRDLASAIAGLGPSLARQAEQWIDAERRAAAGTVLQRMRLRLREPRRRAYALLGDMQARNLLLPDGVRDARLLAAELDRIAAAIDDEEKERCEPPSAAVSTGASGTAG